MEQILHLDIYCLELINGLAGQSELLDKSVDRLGRLNLVKGGVLIAPLWWFWFKDNENQRSTRLLVVQILAGALVAIAVGRAAQILLPLRLRPIYDPNLDFVVPFGVDTEKLLEWSSFPSDHAVLFFALAAGLWRIYRPLGIFAVLWCASVISLPRLYTGLHYPSDIIAGAILGVVIMWAITRLPLMARFAAVVEACSQRWAAPFYTAAFLMTWQLAVLFNDVRMIGRGALQFLRALG